MRTQNKIKQKWILGNKIDKHYLLSYILDTNNLPNLKNHLVLDWEILKKIKLRTWKTKIFHLILYQIQLEKMAIFGIHIKLHQLVKLRNLNKKFSLNNSREDNRYSLNLIHGKHNHLTDIVKTSLHLQSQNIEAKISSKDQSFED